MATIRAHTRINRSADDVWKVVADAGNIAAWFPGMESSSGGDGRRTVVFAGGIEVPEEIVTSDDALRRFQYSIVPGTIGVEHYLGTIDVLEDTNGGSLVIYGADMRPDALIEMIGPSLQGGVEGLKAFCEG
jgi:polyketide cyclase/dehydrase/lipid transport protein